MATATTALKNVIDIVQDGDIGLNVYPIFDEAHRVELNKKIIERYWNREIAHESHDIFVYNMRRKMNEIMPYYNQLYESEKINFDPLSTIDLRTLSSNDTDQTTDSNTIADSEADSESRSRAVSSDTPQTMLSNSEDYATGANDAVGTSRALSKATDNSVVTAAATSVGDSHMYGYQGVASDLLQRYRDSFLNIDVMVVDDLEVLFYQLYGNDDEFTNQHTLDWYGL